MAEFVAGFVIGAVVGTGSVIILGSVLGIEFLRQLKII